MKNKYVDLEVLNHGLKELATKINSVFRKIKDSYTKTEIDDKFTSMAKGMNWKPSVATKVDLEALTDNSKSDTRIVEDESKIYMYNGTSWEGIGSSANVPKATIDNDGLMSKEDFTKLEGIESDKYETKEDFNTKVGSLTSLNTDNKDSVVSAINEVKEGINNTVKIDDTIVDTNKVYSSKKINDTYVQKEENKSLVLDSEIEKIHKHSNIDSLDKISEDENGNPLYNGKLIQAEKEIWTGTKEEYNAITDKKDDITYIVTDEEDNLDINSLVIDDSATDTTNKTWSAKKISGSTIPYVLIDVTKDIDLNEYVETGYYTPNKSFSTGWFTHSILNAPTNGWLPAGGFALEVKTFDNTSSSKWCTQVLYSYVGTDNNSAPMYTRTFFYDGSKVIFSPWKRIADIDDSKVSSEETWSSQKINEENKEIYSTDEVKTNKIWINDKPIYRKVVTQTITTSGAVNIISGFDTSLIDTMISFYGSIKQPWGNIAPISYYNSEEDGAYIYISKESNRFVLNARTTGDVILIVEYTKTID